MKEKTYPYMLVWGTHTSSSFEVTIFVKTPCNLVNTCKLDSGVKTRSEISKEKMFFYFLDMMYVKQKTLTRNTYVQGTTHLDALC